MPAYNATDIHPPAPVAMVDVYEIGTVKPLSQIQMLIDTGADVTLLPRDLVAPLLRSTSGSYELEAFDGTQSRAPIVICEMRFVGKTFRGQFPVVEGRIGILGRNILNNLFLVFHGPSGVWEELRR